MKYLKKYQIFESVKKHITVEEYDQIVSYLNDVFLELKDDDYIVTISPKQKNVFSFYKGISLNIKTPNKEAFISSDILDSLKHAVSYLSDIGFTESIKIRTHYFVSRTWQVDLEDLEK